METKSLYNDTQTLLEARTSSLPNIARETGLNFEWVASMAQKRIPEPGVHKVQKLHDYLVSQQ